MSIPQPIRNFAHSHDDIPAFHAGYLILAILFAALFNLGAFLLLIVAHMSLDLVKYRERHGFSWVKTGEGILRESLNDITLLSIGLALSVYLHHHIGISTISGLLHLHVSIIRSLILLVPKFQILRHFLTVVLHLRRYIQDLHPGMSRGWSGPEQCCFAMIGITLTLVVFAAPLMHVPWSLVGDILAEELIPWRL